MQQKSFKKCLKSEQNVFILPYFKLNENKSFKLVSKNIANKKGNLIFTELRKLLYQIEFILFGPIEFIVFDPIKLFTTKLFNFLFIFNYLFIFN